MKKLLFTVLSALCILLMPAVQAAPTIDIGLVVSQYSAEVEAPAGFIITLPDGSREEYGVGKYFFSAGQGRIRLDKKTYPDGIVLTLQEPKEPAAKAASGKAPAVSKRPAAQRLLSVNKQECPGEIWIYTTDGGTDLTVVNRVSLETYVNSVLGPKSSPIWPDEAIKAQAVAVRSLAWYFKSRQGASLYAVRAMEPGSFYGGERTVNGNLAKVSAQTVGQVLYYDGAPAACYTSESSGGRTVSAAEALGRNIPYLPSVEDYDKDCPGFAWEKRIPVSTISRILNQLGHPIGKLTGYCLSAQDKPDERDRFASGRVRYISWQGETGSVTLTGREFADMLALSSNDFDVFLTEALPDKLDIPIENSAGIEIGRKEMPIDVKGPTEPVWKSTIPGFHFLTGSKDEMLLFRGKGIGTGLGLSKWGARGMADAAGDKAGYYRQILAHYYPGTYLTTVY